MCDPGADDDELSPGGSGYFLRFCFAKSRSIRASFSKYKKKEKSASPSPLIS